ncbi:MAG: exodeoxyribonuclease VII large subunit [Clostridia bacterium]
MATDSSTNQNVVTVSRLVNYIKKYLESNNLLQGVSVKGEISNYRLSQNGHVYFTLKDADASIDCTMWKSMRARLKFAPETGLMVVVSANVTVYVASGKMHLIIESMQPDGIGGLHLAYEQLKEKLEKEGLFDARNKKELPMLPRAVGVITSPTGSVVRDIINVSTRRFPNAKLKIIPVAVQGEGSALQVANAVNQFNQLGTVDVIIIARGGGSFEDLFSFNEEIVARSIFASQIPVISAIGHETDFTIADFVADWRAPTPSAAAELAFPVYDDLLEQIRTLDLMLRRSLKNSIHVKRRQLDSIQNSPSFKYPLNIVMQESRQIEQFEKRLASRGKNWIERLRANLSKNIAHLNALSPLTVLARGYGVLTGKEDGVPILSVAQANIGQVIEVLLKDGTIDARIEDVRRTQNGYEGNQKDV